MTGKQTFFIGVMSNVIRNEAEKRGYKIISPIIAQAILESSWGSSVLAMKYFNYFGMKSGKNWKGKSVNLKTLEEYTAGKTTQITDNFRVYDSLEAGVAGYFDFISLKRYSNLKTAETPDEYIENLKKDGYATSSTYITNLKNLVKKYNLTQYDWKTNKQEKTVEEIAKEVIAGKWGTGTARKKALTNAGYNYSEVQKKVNELLKG